MQATIKLAGGARLIQVEGETQADLFEQMAQAYEVFGETCCGLCGTTNIRPVLRVVDKYRFYEYQCEEQGCRAKLTFGQSQDVKGALFPKRKLLDNGKPDLKEGHYGEHRGWTRYRGDNQQDEPSSHAHQQPQSSLPPLPFTHLRNMLGDMGVSDNEAQFRDAIIQFVTKGTPKGRLTYSACHKAGDAAQHAVDCLQAAIKEHDGDLVIKVQDWMGGKR